ncbi:MAG TPA: LarC family nickel insertion protein [Acidimicrobiales bacterium]
MTTVAWFHCFAGIAGDMAFGALVDAGAPLADVLSIMGRLPVEGWSVDAEPVLRNGIAATQLHVRCEETAIVRTHAHIRALLEEARLPPRVLDRAVAVFGCLAEVEGRLHRRPPDQVHFHEVGGLDAIIDVVGTCAALEVLGVDEVGASPVATGTGMVRTAHGLLPNPAPAVVELLRGAPTHGVDLAVELTTPTGAAILAALAGSFGPLPEMTIAATGFGAGSRVLEHLPNLTQVVLGEAAGSGTSLGGQPAVEVAANVDGHRGDVGPRRERPDGRRRPGRLGDTGGDEEGPPRPHRHRPRRPRPGRPAGPGPDGRDGIHRRSEQDGRALDGRPVAGVGGGGGAHDPDQGQPGTGQGRARRRRPSRTAHGPPRPGGGPPGGGDMARRRMG